MSMMDKLVNLAAWILLCLFSFFAASRVYVDWVMHTHIHSNLILTIFFALIFWGFFTIFSKLGIWTGGGGRE